MRGSDVLLQPDGLIYYARSKGGSRSGKRITDPDVIEALLTYLKAGKRKEKDVFGRDVPVWLAHDRGPTARHVKKDLTADTAAQPPAAIVPIHKPKKLKGLTSNSFARRMKIYAERAGIFNFHLHQLRHTFARVVSEDTGSLEAAQEALGHKSMQTTRIYVPNIEIRADIHSSRLRDRLKRTGNYL